MKRAKKIIDNVYWVGVRDLNNRHFHGDLYPIDEGCTYNAYLVVDDEVTLFDTVEEEFTEELLERVESVLQGREIDNIVVQHTEPDRVDLKKYMPNIQTQKFTHLFLERRI